jgi:hypothetical protein
MIIKYPTGFYKNVLPAKNSDSTSVTYVISNNLPPRSSLVFPKLPEALVNRRVNRPTQPPAVSPYGALAVTVTKSAPSNVLSGVKAIDLGQVLEFEDAATQIVAPMLVSFDTEVRHDTNKYDLSEIGIGAEDQAGFLEAIKRGQQEVRQRLNTAIKQRADAEIEIDRLNKSISEAEKTKSASVFANSAIGGSEELSKAVLNIDKRLSELKLGLEAQIALANGLVLTADDLRNQYLTLCKLVN